MNASRFIESGTSRKVQVSQLSVKIISSWKSNPEEFKRWVSDESDFVKYLYDDSVSVDCKLALLTHFQEVAPGFILNTDRLEETCWSLNGLLHNSSYKDNAFFRSKLLTTITSILLSCDENMSTNEALSDLLLKHVQHMISILSKPKREALLVKIAASQSLEEIETCHPRSLQPYLEVVWLSCQQETSSACHYFVCLLSIIIKNIFCNDVPSVEPAFLVRQTSLQHQYIETDSLPIAMYCLDLLPSLTPISVFFTLKYLLNVVKSDIVQPIPILKMWLPRLYASYFVPWLHAAMEIEETLEQAGLVTLKKVIHLQKYSSLSTAHRLLFLEWIEASSQNDLMVGFYKEFIPLPFDGCDTKSKKIKILCSMKSPVCLLLKCIEDLYSGVKYCGRPTVNFFQTLYFCFLVLSSSAISHLSRFFLYLVDLSPAAVIHVMDFVSCIQGKMPDSSVDKEILGNVLNHLLEMHPERCIEKLEWYLKFMQRVFEESPTISRPKDVLKFLKKLLNLRTVRDNWMIGHDILSTILCILQNQDIKQLHSDLGEILYMLMMYSDDIDIKSRAKMYYAVMMSMTPEKVKQLFDLAVEIDNRDRNYLEEGSSAFPLAHPIQELTERLLTISKVSSNRVDEIGVLDETNFENVFDYIESINSRDSNKIVRLTYCLKVKELCEPKFQKIFGVKLHIFSNTTICSTTSAVVIPVLSDHQNDVTFDIDVTVVVPQPLILVILAEFSAVTYETYTSKLEPLQVKFHDLFLPLPICSKRQSWLFDELWVKFMTDGHHTIATYSVPFEELELKWIHCRIDEERVGIFLPPSSHLLLKFSPRDCILVATDTLSILLWLNNFVSGTD